jgi:hypothetical protein
MVDGGSSGSVTQRYVLLGASEPVSGGEIDEEIDFALLEVINQRIFCLLSLGFFLG